MPNFTMDHVGWITKNTELFERFWVGVMGYEAVKETAVDPDLARALFHHESMGRIIRYRKENAGPDIEIHAFVDGCDPAPQTFQRFGINHICIHTGGPGSRQEFIDALPSDVKVHTYDNPKGWKNHFIQDYEGNWIELRERL